MSLCEQRLQEERKKWRKDHPFGFYAKPIKKKDGSLNIRHWEAGIPGKKDTLWSRNSAIYPIQIEYPADYPSKPPKISFPAGFYHPNVYPSGKICLSILNEGEDWKPSITLKQIVLGIQELLNNPNPNSPAQDPAYRAFTQNKIKYDENVEKQSKKYTKA